MNWIEMNWINCIKLKTGLVELNWIRLSSAELLCVLCMMCKKWKDLGLALSIRQPSFLNSRIAEQIFMKLGKDIMPL
jgi:hypothetical protein